MTEAPGPADNSSDDAQRRADALRDRMRHASPEFQWLFAEVLRLGVQLDRHAALAKLDASLLANSDRAGAAAHCRGQAELARESAGLQAQMATAYDNLAAYFERQTSAGG